jgi:biopolymer transport protein ExbD
MRFAPRPRRALPESIIPMINVVFLLLIFFLMSARLAPPPPVDVHLPSAGSDTRATEGMVLYLTIDGPAMGDLRGDAVWQAMAAVGLDQTLTLHADAALSGADVAQALARLAGLGMAQVELAVREK